MGTDYSCRTGIALAMVMLAAAAGCSSCSGRSRGKAAPDTPHAGVEASQEAPAEPMSEQSILAFALEAAEAALVPTLDQEPNLSLRFLVLTDLAVAYMRAGMIDKMGDCVDRIVKTKNWQSSPALADVARACANAGRIDLAEEVADKIENSIDRAAAFIAVAEPCMLAGRDAKAADLIARGVKAAKNAEPQSYDIQEPGSDMRIWISDNAPAFSLLLDAAEAYVKAGRMDEAEGLAGLVEAYQGDHFWKGNLAGWRAKILLEAADGRLKAGKKDSALETLTRALADIDAMITEKVGDTEDKTSLLLRAAGLFDEMGQKDKGSKLLARALDEARSLQKVDVADIRVANGCGALALVAEKHVDLGAGVKAVEILEEAVKIVESEKKMGKYGGDGDRAVALARIASVYAKAGESVRADELLSRASDAAAKVKDPCWRAQAQADLVDICVEMKEHDRAKTAAAALQAASKAATASCWVGGGEGFVKLVEALAGEGRLDESMAAADMMDPSWYKVEALTALANHCEEDGEREKAGRAVLKALEAVEAEKDLWARELLLIANTYAASKEKADPASLAVLEKILKKEP